MFNRFKLLATTTFVLASLYLSATTSATTTVEHGDTIHVLFIGNSLTYYNEMPQTFRRIVEATSPGVQVDVRYVAGDGLMLEDHWKSKWTQARLRERAWDYVVLQEQGGLSHWIRDNKSHPAPPESFDTHVDKFAQVAQSTGAKVVLYETAAVRPNEMSYVAWAYTQAANRTHAILAPAGEVFYAMGEKTRKELLPDGHPNPQGSCIVAATLASAMFNSKAQPLLDACGNGDSVLAASAPVIDDQLAKLGKPGAYNSPPTPTFEQAPSVRNGNKLDARGLAGTWYAKESGLPLSLGVRMALSGSGRRLSAMLDNYGANTRIGMRIDGLETDGGVLRLTSHGDGRVYHYILARHGDNLAGYAVASVNGAAAYTPVTFTREAHPDTHFATLERLQQTFDQQRRENGLDQALLDRYKALNDWLGSKELERLVMGSPMSGPWLAILTGSNYADLGNDALALEYFTFAVRHFPNSADAYGARGEQLEDMRRKREALPDLTRAALLLGSDHTGSAETDFGWRRDQIERELGNEPSAMSSASP
jgi:tetratricopeptide (TPR) repeat protein